MYLHLVGARVEALPVRNHDLWITIMYTMQYISVICVTPSKTQHKNTTRLNLNTITNSKLTHLNFEVTL